MTEDMERRLDTAEWALKNAGFRRCDSPACNCNSWHEAGGFFARFNEIKEVVEGAGYSTNGRTLLDAVKAMAADANGRRERASDLVNVRVKFHHALDALDAFIAGGK